MNTHSYDEVDINTLKAQASSLGFDTAHHNQIAKTIEDNMASGDNPSDDDKARAEKHRRVAIASDEVKTLIEELLV